MWNWYLDDCVLFPHLYVKCEYEWFGTTWRTHFGEIVRLRRHCKFSKCDTCLALRAIKDNRKLTMSARLAAREKLTVHYKWIKAERQESLSKAFRAVRNPTEWLSIAQDGTNQLPFGFPNFREVDKTLDTNRIKTHLMIDIVHGRGCYTYITPEARVFSDPNCTIECLQRTLQKVEISDGYLPPNLNLQLDNCWRENKNAYVVAYLTWLVERGVFQKIILSFLPVGHTHNEADQCASCFSVGCRNNDIKTMQDLTDTLKQSYYPKPMVEYISEVMCLFLNMYIVIDHLFMEQVADVQTMMNPDRQHHYGSTSHIKQSSNVSQPLHFYFTTDADGRGCVRTKLKCTDPLWSVPFYPLKCENNKLGAPEHPFLLSLDRIPGMVVNEDREVCLHDICVPI